MALKRQRLTQKGIEHAPLPAEGQEPHVLWDDVAHGLGLRIRDSGKKTWIVMRRLKGRAQPVRLSLGTFPNVSLADARLAADEAIRQMAKGIDPRMVEQEAREAATRAATGTVDVVASAFLERYAKKHQRSWPETERIFKVYVLPKWRARQLTTITRRDVVELLDGVEDNHGPVMADRVLAAVRKMFNWQATRDDRLIVPIVKGMARTKPKQRARQRVLSDAEIRALWVATSTAQPAGYGALVRMLLLSAQRKQEVAQMRRAEIEGDIWTIPPERYKTGLPNVVPLPQAARAIIAAQPRLGKTGWVFTTTGKAPLWAGSKAKRDLDAKMLAELRKADSAATLPGWVLHDLRRTAKTLMGRAGVRPDISERVLGHVIAGVAGVYDRYAYLDEKRAALDLLAAEIERVLNPPAAPAAAPAAANIVPFKR